jgi:hypothetical protein
VNRTIHVFVIALAVAVIAPASPAFAQEAPTKEQLDKAKTAFAEGRSLHEQGKLGEAVEKFKESYRLSRNPLLLYNIGLTLEETGDKNAALFYYRRFLADAPKNAAQRKDVTKRVDQIEKEALEADLAGTKPTTTTTTTTGTGTGTTRSEEPKAPVKIKPAGTYNADAFEHQMVEQAPPGKPLDVTAFVPEDSGFTVTLHYRGGGDAKFVAKPMKWRYKELVARIPGSKIAGTSIQYYLEVKDQAGNVVTRSGKSTSPNLVYVEAGATPRFYPDLTDDGEAAITPTQQRRRDEEDPLGRKQMSDPDPDPIDDTPTVTGTGYADVGSAKFNRAKWVSTGVAGGLVAGAIVTYILGKQQASNIIADRDARMGNTCMQPPCFEFDQYDIDVEKAGKRYNSLHTLTAVTGVIAAGVAGYFWYRELTAKKRGDARTVNKTSGAAEWAVMPALGQGFAGAAAAARF